MRRNLVLVTRRNNQLDTATDQQSPEYITVIGSVGNGSLRIALITLPDFYLDAINRRICQHYLCGGSRLQVYSERNTLAIGQH